MLVGGGGMTKPGQIAQVHQGFCLPRTCAQLIAKAVFIADVERQPVAGQLHGCLHCTARAKTCQWHVQVAIYPAGQPGERYKFAKWHQMILAVYWLWRGQRQHGVVIPFCVLRILVGNAGHQLAALRARAVGQPGQHARRSLIGKQRNGGFRQNHHPGGILIKQLLIGLQGVGKSFWPPFHFLGDIAL